MAKLRPELRKRLPPFNPTVADDAFILLDAIEAGRWADIEAPRGHSKAWSDLSDDERAIVTRANEIAEVRARVMESALVEYARLYTARPTSVIAEETRRMLREQPGGGWYRTSQRVWIKDKVNHANEWEYVCKLCQASIATISHAKSDSNLPQSFWIKLRRHCIRCACLLVIETHEQMVYRAKVASGELRDKGRWETEPPPARIACPPPPRSIQT